MPNDMTAWVQLAECEKDPRLVDNGATASGVTIVEADGMVEVMRVLLPTLPVL